MTHTISPFANESDAIQLGDLNIENRLDQVTIYGSLDLTKDQEGLKNALVLKGIIDKVVNTLTAAKLPEKLPAPEIKTVKNPFQKN